jgi:hypothetical protein
MSFGRIPGIKWCSGTKGMNLSLPSLSTLSPSYDTIHRFIAEQG